MNIGGSFVTASPVEALRELASAPEALESVSTLEDVDAAPGAAVTARFVPVTALGRFVLRVTITPVSQDDRGARLHVIGRQGNHLVSVDIALVFTAEGGATTVTWDADVAVRGAAASVGQRVARDIAQRVIGEVLAEAASVPRRAA